MKLIDADILEKGIQSMISIVSNENPDYEKGVFDALTQVKDLIRGQVNLDEDFDYEHDPDFIDIYGKKCLDDFETLKGKTIIKIIGLRSGNNEVRIYCLDGSKYLMCHFQSCCESVEIDDVIGDVDDLIGSPLTIAGEIVAEAGSGFDEGPKGKFESSHTWTFYKLATIKGYVTIKWYGTSNGYYSEKVDFVRVK